MTSQLEASNLQSNTTVLNYIKERNLKCLNHCHRNSLFVFTWVVSNQETCLTTLMKANQGRTANQLRKFTGTQLGIAIDDVE